MILKSFWSSVLWLFFRIYLGNSLDIQKSGYFTHIIMNDSQETL